jgi:hypothetical protein|nr:MAG TPA: hypothetical protein [Caudoviricetes sp.]
MDHAQYVNKVGKQINDSTKMNVDIDNTSVTNIVLIPHLEVIYNQLESDLKKNDPDFPFTQEDLIKIGGYINCLKKQINFYEIQDIDNDCILTEIEEHIIQE